MNGAFVRCLVLAEGEALAGEAEAMDAWQSRVLDLLAVCPVGPVVVVGASAATMVEARELVYGVPLAGGESL